MELIYSISKILRFVVSQNMKWLPKMKCSSSILFCPKSKFARFPPISCFSLLMGPLVHWTKFFYWSSRPCCTPACCTAWVLVCLSPSPDVIGPGRRSYIRYFYCKMILLFLLLLLLLVLMYGLLQCCHYFWYLFWMPCHGRTYQVARFTLTWRAFTKWEMFRVLCN